MSLDTIHPETTLGPVALKTRDLPRSIAFYTDIIGMSLTDDSGRAAHLGVDGKRLLTLREDSRARPAPRTAGLYHFAILVPSRLDLAHSIKRLADSRASLQGFADHWVSEAVYLADPDGNGIEIYRDRPRDQWPRKEGQLQMATDPLDVNGILEELQDSDDEWAGLAPGTTIGHIHLQVSNLPAAVDFYREALGFDLILRYGPSAAFLSAGGYHHHVGCNTWAGVGIPSAPPDATGLVHFTIDLPGADALEGTVQRLQNRSLRVEPRDAGYFVRDPSGIGMILRSTAGNGR